MRRIRVFTLLLFMVAMLTSCAVEDHQDTAGVEPASGNEMGAVAFEVAWPDETPTNQFASFTGSNIIPASVNFVRVTVTGSGITTQIRQTFPASARTGTVGGVPAGSGRTVLIEALASETGTALYSATLSGVTVVAGPQPYAGGTVNMVMVDGDFDGVPTGIDNCPLIGNPDQANSDGVGTGDACESTSNDTDGDGIANTIDNCPTTANPSQTDSDGDGTGDVCDSTPYPVTDTDGDGIANTIDNCPTTANASQTDSDGDGIGDACDSSSSPAISGTNTFDEIDAFVEYYSYTGFLWTRDSSERHTGTSSARSTSGLLNNQSSSLYASRTVPAGNFSFWYKVSSEAGYDKLTFYVDNVAVGGPWSGTVGWAQFNYTVTAGTHEFKWTYAKDSSGSSGSDAAWIDDVVLPGTVTFETGMPASFTTTGWTVTSTTAQSGTKAAEAPQTLANNGVAYLQIQKATGTGNVSFWRKVDSEVDFDWLDFYIDGVLKDSWSGSLPWELKSYAVSAGTHTFRWEYSKDVDISSGLDTAWVDDIFFP